MSGWIKIDKNLTESMRFRRVVRAMKSNALCSVTDKRDEFITVLAMGALVKLWMFADSHVDDDNTLAITLDEINELVGIDGFAQALPADWLQIIDSDHVQLPNFLEHNGSSEKLRRDNARRQAEYRHRHSNSNVTRDVTVTNGNNDARSEKTRRDKTRPEHTQERAHDVPHGTEAEFFERFTRLRAGYPKAQREDWITAEKRIRELLTSGEATWPRLEQGVERYAELVRATGRLVLNPARYFGDVDKPWAQDWPLPATPADAAAEQRRERERLAWERAEAHAARAGCPLKRRPADTPETFETAIATWENSQPRRTSGPAPLLRAATP